ncbi:MAG: GNVR domain-containing protein [Pyrinomonadaceae bacterium]
MSVEFRQRTPGEYARILWRRKWLIMLPALAVTLAVAWVVWKLPNVYESTTLLTVKPSSISSSIVPQLPENDLTIRINNIGQEVVSRSALEPLIVKYNLYAVERLRNEPMDALVERMRTKDINVRVNTSRNDVTNGFFLSFRGPDPRTTQAVAADLASKYVTAETKAAGEVAGLTKEFFQNKLQQAKDELDSIDKQRLDFMLAHQSSLPSQGAALIGQMAGLREQQKALMMEIGRLNDQRASLSNMIVTVGKAREQQLNDVARQFEDPKSTPAYAELVKRKAQLEADKQALLTIYKPKHPDVLSVQNQIDSVQREMNSWTEEGNRKVEARRKELEGRVDPQLSQYKSDIERYDNEIKRQQLTLAQTEAQINDTNSRVNGLATSEVGLEAINREYQSKKSVYDSLLEQQQKAVITSDITVSAQGETISVIDTANLPEQPVAPKRPMLIALGLFLGLACGLACAALFEVPRLLTIQTSEDAEHYTGLPVLVSLPNMLTAREQRRIKLRRAALAFAGVAVAIVSVPALYAFLRLTRLIEMFAMRG